MIPSSIAIPYEEFDGKNADERLVQAVEWSQEVCPGRVWTLEEIAQVWGVSRERVRQIESRAIKKIRKYHLEMLDNLKQFEL